ncbi:unnamed protein product [Calypogeia fissa]
MPKPPKFIDQNRNKRYKLLRQLIDQQHRGSARQIETEHGSATEKVRAGRRKRAIGRATTFFKGIMGTGAPSDGTVRSAVGYRSIYLLPPSTTRGSDYIPSHPMARDDVPAARPGIGRCLFMTRAEVGRFFLFLRSSRAEYPTDRFLYFRWHATIA